MRRVIEIGIEIDDVQTTRWDVHGLRRRDEQSADQRGEPWRKGGKFILSGADKARGGVFW